MKFFLIFSLFFNITFAYEVKDFKLKSFSRKENTTINFKNTKKIIILNFWATWCTSCIEELPLLHSLQKKNKDAQFFAISAGDSKRKIKKFIKKYPFNYNILMDKDKAYSKSIGVESLPVTIIIKGNTIVYSGHRPPKDLDF